jgi:hypothetical protein
MMLNFIRNNAAVWDTDLDEDEEESEEYNREMFDVEDVHGYKMMHEWCKMVRASKPTLEFLMKMSSTMPGAKFSHLDVESAVVQHYLDILSYNDREILLRKTSQMEGIMKTYFNQRIVFSTGEEVIYELYNGIEAKNTYHRFHMSDNSWEIVEKGDLQLEEFIKKDDPKIFMNKTFGLFGFIWRNRSDDRWVFKLKEKKLQGESNQVKEGFECRSGIQKLLTKIPDTPKLLQLIVSHDNSGKRISEICVVVEIMMRFLNTAEEERMFFLTSEQFKRYWME